ncbi:ABC transporter substrate-binding protein [Bdellovibrio sp. SKB1291214]|uniref:substrate-binding periplasmic protein n=1 Tax=Bdellovibrio sp. SKB1291214 TaxID=1732569 RepID=UPI0022404C07|nr:ABC transporter substrate-binding protein [Bdellovibrio sp. SKB1291214]UYL07989.1 ABC transporter substrate-binding protein [Bdellovibrio sp. SKB1291214]
MSSSFAKELPPIVFGVNMDYAMPLVQIKNESGNSELTSGILKDLGEAIAKELKTTPKWFLVPKRRVSSALTSGRVDLICHLSEVLQPKIKDDVWWSAKLYRSANVLVFSKDHAIQSIKDIYYEPVGVVLNFIYTGLDPMFKAGTIKREDGPNNLANIHKLLKGRINYIVMSNLEFAYYEYLFPGLTFQKSRNLKSKTSIELSRPFIEVERWLKS